MGLLSRRNKILGKQTLVEYYKEGFMPVYSNMEARNGIKELINHLFL